MGIKIIGIGSYAPERVLTNFDLEKIVDTTDEWISTRTGMKERRIAREDEPTSELGVNAAKKALDMSGVKAEDIDLIVVGTVTPDSPLPSNACLIQKEIGAIGAACFDFQAACSGFIYGLEIITAMMKSSRKYKKALLIGSEKLSHVTNWEDRNTCVLFGDAAGAVVLEKSKDSGDTLLASALHADGTHSDLLMIPGGGTLLPITKENIDDKLTCIQMEGNKVFKLAVNAMVGACKEALELSNLTCDDLSWVIPHQANMRIINAVGTRLSISPERVATNLHKYGNTSAASIILVLDELTREDKLKQGDKILLTAFGGGMTWASAVLKWHL
ncbi:MAG: ketoacyl-ACP synthase III [bacterium]|nr:ketoacyl-ACP synthase III [bacterium]